MKRFLIIGFATAVLGAGCRSVGPDTISRDRFDYTSAIADSAKNQVLLNIVKLRYGDMPVFVDVSSVISQYSLENNTDYSFGWAYPPTVRTPSVGGSTKYAERPTITYMPLTGDKFSKSILTPIPPSVLLFLVQSGRPVDIVFYMCVQSVNGINNRYDAPMRSMPMHPDFVEMLTRMRRMQQSGNLGMRVQVVEKNQTTVFFFGKDVTQELAEDTAWVKQKLGLNTQTNEFKVIYGAAAGPDEIAVVSRSVMEIMVQLASSIDIPADDIRQNRAYAVAKAEDPFIEKMNIHVRSGRSKPADVFVSILYRDKWFWIEDTDFWSKQLLSSIHLLLSLMESGSGANSPVLTVSAG